MYLAVHIFRRDSRHLWRAIALAQLLLAALTVADGWRSDPQPGMFEGWSNILVPAVWAFLLAMAVIIDPLTGRQQFWATTPISWSTLLAAKLLFALCWVQLPYLASCAAVVAARGFEPWLFLPQLLAKQLLIAAAITAPALALAAIVRNLSHFALCLLAAAGLAAWSFSAPSFPDTGSRGAESFRPLFVLAVLAAGMSAALLLQFSRRHAQLGRATAGASFLAALLLAALWPRHGDALVAAFLAFDARPPATVRLPTAADASALPRIFRNSTPPLPRRTNVALPAAITGFDVGELVLLEQATVSLDSASGQRIEAELYSPRNRSHLPALLAFFSRAPGPTQPAWQILNFDRAAFERFRLAPAQLHAAISLTVHHRRPSVWMNLDQPAIVPGAGRCSATERDVTTWQRALVVLCESLETPSPLTQARLYQPASGLDIMHRFQQSRTFVSWPTSTWLSPVHRRTTFFQISEEPVESPSGRWMVDRRRLAGARLEITPARRVSTQFVRYSASGLDLNRYVFQPAR